MKNIILTVLLLNTVVLITNGQTVDVGYLNPTQGGGAPYKYLRFGTPDEFYGGFMWNNTQQSYGNGDDFTIFSYHNRDINIQTATGNFIVFPSAGGKMGIGTTSPAAKLDVQGGGISISGQNSIPSINNFKNLLQLKDSQHAALVYNPGETTELMFGFHSNGSMYWGSKSDGYSMKLTKTGGLQVIDALWVGDQAISGYKLSIDGKVAAKEVNVTVNGWADHVFEPKYQLQSLSEVKQYIAQYGHLPNIPNAKEVAANGINVGEMTAKLLEKIEELTLHLIEQDNHIRQQAAQLAQQQQEMAQFKKEIKAQLRN